MASAPEAYVRECTRCYEKLGADRTAVTRIRLINGRAVRSEARSVCPACSVALELALRNSDDGGELSDWGSEEPKYSPEYVRAITGKSKPEIPEAYVREVLLTHGLVKAMQLAGVNTIALDLDGGQDANLKVEVVGGVAVFTVVNDAAIQKAKHEGEPVITMDGENMMPWAPEGDDA